MLSRPASNGLLPKQQASNPGTCVREYWYTAFFSAAEKKVVGVSGILTRSIRPLPSPLFPATPIITPVVIRKVLGMFNWDEVETLVCGKPEVDVDLLEVFKGGPWGKCLLAPMRSN